MMLMENFWDMLKERINRLESIFNFDWLNNVEDIYTNAKTNETEIVLHDLLYPVRFCTGPYGGYIITIKDLDTNEMVSFNCDRIDLEPEHIDNTYLYMRNKFAINSNGAYFSRKNIKVVSITVPKEVYNNIMNKFNINNSLLWRIWNYCKHK